MGWGGVKAKALADQAEARRAADALEVRGAEPDASQEATDDADSSGPVTRATRIGGPSRGRESYQDQFDRFLQNTLPSQVVPQLGRTSLALQAAGAGAGPVTITQSIWRKAIDRHGVPRHVLRNLPSLIADPVIIFQSEAAPSHRVVLVEDRLPDGRAVVVAVELAATRAGVGQVTDIRSIHPKEHDARLLHWIQKGLARYWNPQKTRAFLQDSAPANWGQYEGRLAQTSISSESLKNKNKPDPDRVRTFTPR